MNYAVLLSGGIGSRVGTEIPKQYIEVSGKPVIEYSLSTISNNSFIDRIIIVAAKQWQNYLRDLIEKKNISKFLAFADAGISREHSVLNGFKTAEKAGAKKEDIIVVHDAARPLVTDEVINNCILAMQKYDCAIPAIKERNALYLSKDQEHICGTINRDELFCGQTPECFHFGSYYSLIKNLSDQELSDIKGCCELAVHAGLNAGIVQGTEILYKISTEEDLERFKEDLLYSNSLL